MAPNTPNNSNNSVKTVLEPIVAVLGLITTLWVLSNTLIQSALAQILVIIFLAIIITYLLIRLRGWTWPSVLLMWITGGFIIAVIYVLVSQPVTVVGYVTKADQTVLGGVTLTITNSSGVDQKSVADKDGRFEVNGVPAGNYSIFYNGNLVYSGEIPSGLRRIFAPTINIGTYPLQIADTPPSSPPATAQTIISNPNPTWTPPLQENSPTASGIHETETMNAVISAQIAVQMTDLAYKIQTVVAVPTHEFTPLLIPTPTSTPVVTTETASQAVERYWGLVDAQRFEQSWAMLSAKFRCYFNNNNDYQPYVNLWSALRPVSAQARGESVGTDGSTLVDTRVTYTQNGVSKTLATYYHMKRDMSGNWLFEDGTTNLYRTQNIKQQCEAMG